jgi:hypothetical protein
MALTAAREMPARFARSACDHSRASRCACTVLDDMILSFTDMIVSLRGKNKRPCTEKATAIAMTGRDIPH